MLNYIPSTLSLAFLGHPLDTYHSGGTMGWYYLSTQDSIFWLHSAISRDIFLNFIPNWNYTKCLAKVYLGTKKIKMRLNKDFWHIVGK